MAKKNIIKGKVFIAGDNIDTDQIIPAQYLNLVPTIKEEYEKLGSYAMCGLPDAHKTRYISKGKSKTEYPIIIAGNNFGCGSSREHAPISLGAAGCKAVIAKSFARIFFRNCIATGEVYPVEINDDLNQLLKTGDEIEIDLDHKTIKVSKTGRTYSTRDLGAVKEVIDAGGIFNFARNSGMIK
jgi:3-isopropylmalate/(R)-2-methylmalate dehydratase small subunit